MLTPLLLVTAAIVGDATGKIAEWFVKDWGIDGHENEEMNKEGGLAFFKSWALWPLRSLKRRSIFVLVVLWGLNQMYL